jgi:hypothetical protein
MKPIMKKGAAMILLSAMITHEAAAFCGFYVSKADGTLKNKTSQVLLVRDGNRNVITMYNDFKGILKILQWWYQCPLCCKKKILRW